MTTPTPAPAAEPRRIAGRYALRAPLGRGAHGEVWEAHDELLGETVAVKLLALGSREDEARVRREVSVLRLLDLPGVVRLFDEGIEGETLFVVMERVAGAPFPGPGVARPAGWGVIAPRAVAAIEALGRVHAAGVLHRDLKPENLLIDEAGRPHLLDFGLSHDAVLGEDLDAGYMVGTPAYLAPEQILGEPASAASDLYALGVMLYVTLAGRLPHAADDVPSLFDARLSAPPPPLSSVATHVPAGVAATIDRLLSIEPGDRPAGAAALLALLESAHPELEGPRSARALRLGRGGAPLRPDQLRDLFAGPDRFFHLREDAADVLFARTQGDPEGAAIELTAWVRAGLARADGDRFSIDRGAIERLRAGLLVVPVSDALAPTVGIEARLLALLGDPAARADRVADEAAAVARAHAGAGRLGRAVAALAEGLSAVRGLRRAPGARAPDVDRGEEALIDLWVELAVLEATPRALDRALYELCRAGLPPPRAAALEALCRAALALAAGSDRALPLSERVPPFDRAELERARWSVRVLAARRASHDRLDAVVEGARAWAEAAGDARSRGAYLGFLGRLRYQQGRFEESAALHEQAAEQEPWATARTAQLLHGATSWLDAFAFDRADALAERAERAARACRNPQQEALAAVIRRVVAYRAARAPEPDPDLARAVAAVGIPDLEAAACAVDAAVHLRCGDLEQAALLSSRARRLWEGMSKRSPARLMRCLEVATGRSGAAPAEVDDLCRSAIACPVAGMGVQMLGLVARGDPARAPGLREAALRLAETVPRAAFDARIDVLSARESLEALGLSSRDPSGET